MGKSVSKAVGKSVSEATSKGDSAKFVLKEGSENSTDYLIELLSESVTSKEEYSFLLFSTVGVPPK